MPDREKVKTGFELCANGEPCMGEKFTSCPFSPRNNAEQNCGVTMARNAIAKLKEQEEQIDRLIEENASNAEMAEGLRELLKEQDKKQYNNHEVACIIAEIVGDECACNVNGIDEWLPNYCDFRETCCPNPVGVACWEQYLKYKDVYEGR